MDIFVGYKSEDRERVRRLAAALGDLGYTVFWDQHIPAGSTWRQTIGKALMDARLVIICWSKETLDTDAAKWVLDEADEAARTKKPMVPVRLDDVSPPMGHRQIQALDLSGWTGDKRDPAFAELQFAIAVGLNGRILQGGAIPRHKKSKLGAALWLVGIALAAGGGFAAGQFLPPQFGQRVADAPLIAAAADEPSDAQEEPTYVQPFDTRLLVEEVAAAVGESRRIRARRPSGMLMGGQTIGVSSLTGTDFSVCIDFPDGSMFEGQVVRRAGAPPEAANVALDEIYVAEGFGVIWRPDGTVESQGVWEDGRLVSRPNFESAFRVSTESGGVNSSCQEIRGGVPPMEPLETPP